MRRKKLDQEKILKMYDAGLPVDEIAKAVGGHEKTVKDILRMNERIRKCSEENLKCPIHPVQIQSLKEQIQIGQMIWIEVQGIDEEFHMKKEDEKCRVVEKYPHLLLALDSRGRRRTVTYAELAVKGRMGQ